jgi:hypothetical protein
MATLADLTRPRGFEVLEHLEADAQIPLINGIQFQGDVAIIPTTELGGKVSYSEVSLTPVGSQGVVVVEGTGGGHTHLLVADPGAARWSAAVKDVEDLAVGVVDVRPNSAAYLLHAEHGGTGLAPGRYVIRRQREQADEDRLVAD